MGACMAKHGKRLQACAHTPMPGNVTPRSRCARVEYGMHNDWKKWTACRDKEVLHVWEHHAVRMECPTHSHVN